MNFIKDLKSELWTRRNPGNAVAMSAYMKGKFPFLGIKSPERKTVLKELVKVYKSQLLSGISEVVVDLYKEAEREYHYCAIELFAKIRKDRYEQSDMATILFLITNHSHWDSVDFIAKHIYGQYLVENPSQVRPSVEDLINSNNMWLHRTSLLFQLGYKKKTDSDLLFAICNYHKDSDEFFIQKAIGWALREYAKVNPHKVLNFVNRTQLKPLSKKEAIRRLI